MNALSGAGANALEIRACPRVRALEQGERPGRGLAMVACDFGPQITRDLHRVNLAARDPWFLRAAEVSPRLRFDAERWRLYDKQLQLFALAHLDHFIGKLALPSPEGGIVLSAVAAGHDEPEWLPPGGWHLEAARRLRLQFIAGNGPTLLSRHGGRLRPLLEAATAG